MVIKSYTNKLLYKIDSHVLLNVEQNKLQAIIFENEIKSFYSLNVVEVLLYNIVIERSSLFYRRLFYKINSNEILNVKVINKL